MAIKGFKRTRTKPQDLREIVQKQNGFLGGLCEDLPKSDVGDTQTTVLRNALPFRDRIEARGGIKPQVNYLEDSSSDDATLFDLVPRSLFYDDDWDEIFTTNSGAAVGTVRNFGTSGLSITPCYNYGTFAFPTIKDLKRKGNKVVLSINASQNEFALIEYRDSTDYFIRPTVSDGGAPIVATPPNTTTGSGPSPYFYGWSYTFVRKDANDYTIAESPFVAAKWVSQPNAEYDGTVVTTLVADITANAPAEYFLAGGSDNFYTHIRMYRSTVRETATEAVAANSFYACGDWGLDDLTPPASTSLDMNVSDSELLFNPVYIFDGYEPVRYTEIFSISSGMLITRNEAKKNEFIYCLIGAGDNERYFGWYNPLFQYGSVDGDITSITDLGSYVVITTSSKTYTVDTVNYIEDEGQRSLGVFTPILSPSSLISDRVGIELNHRRAFVRAAIGSAIGFTSDGEIRGFSGYQWGEDISQSKVHKTTKGLIRGAGYICSAEFVNDSYYLSYNIPLSTGYVKLNTLRLGTTEEAGNGFSHFDGDSGISGTQLGWPDYTNNFQYNFPEKMFLNIKGVLNVLRPQYDGTTSVFYTALYEYTGDKFDKKLNKDVIDVYDGFKAYQSTEYIDVPCEVEIPEATGSSEGYTLYFLKSNFYLRGDRFSYKVANETTKGYEITDVIGTGVGEIATTSLSDIEFGMDLRVDESEDIVTFNDNFTPSSAVTSQREVQGHRIRTTMRANSAGFQLTGVEIHYKRHDRTEMEETDTTSAVTSLSTGLLCMIDQRLKNLCMSEGRGSRFDIGVPFEGALIRSSQDPILLGIPATITDGPDGNLTGLSMLGASDYEFQSLKGSDTENKTVMYWERGIEAVLYTAWTGSGVDKVEFTSSTASGSWQHVTHVSSSSTGTKDIYINGVLSSSVAITADEAYRWGNPSVKIALAENIADIRIYDKALTVDEILFYIDNVLNNEGDYFNGY